jgi:hypothetical protein
MSNRSPTSSNYNDAKNYITNKSKKLLSWSEKNRIAAGVIVVLLIIIVVVLATREKFESVAPVILKVDSTQMKDANIDIPPRLYDRQTGLITDASQFVTLPNEIVPAWGLEQDNSLNNYGLVDKLDDGNSGLMGLNYNMCSKSCCSKQYPTPFTQDVDVVAESNSDNFTPSQYTCNNAWQNTGCVCMTKKQKEFLASRGNNNN